MRRSRRAAAIVSVLVWGALLAGARGASGLSQDDFSAHVTFTSDYVFRGVSQTNEDPAVQGGISFENRRGFFAGLWGSNVDFRLDATPGQRPDLELNLHLGYGRDLGQDWTAYAALVHYEYPGDGPAFDYDYDELHLGVQYRELAALVVALSKDAFGQGQPLAAYELTGRYPLVWELDLGAGVGHYDLQGPYGVRYWYWNLGLSRRLGSFVLDLGYFATDGAAERRFGTLAGQRLVLSLTAFTR